ncbi:amidohydrolase family protein [Salinibacterium sp. TMP30]|uniref:amidohydrolase family protein n=1 Tax=Salinibacterium sp. TMP30 TaxID=3138237 RepID=UPI003139B548
MTNDINQGWIDSHFHYWRVSRGDYPWMPKDGPLRRDHLPAELRKLSAETGVVGNILVQAAPTVNETEYLLGIADASPEVLGVVGWVDMEDGSFSDLQRFTDNEKFVGIRPMIQDIDDDAWITRPSVFSSLKELARVGLSFDLLCNPRHLEYAVPVLKRVPELRVVVDHLAKPDYRNLDDDWRKWMGRLAAMPNVACKVAGLVSEAGTSWRNADFTSHIDVVLDQFGPDRLMIGTDWPVLNGVASYTEVVELYEQIFQGLSPSEKAAIWSKTAVRSYGLVT